MSPEELEGNLVKFNPVERLSPIAAAKIPILHIHGDADDKVTMEENNAAIQKRYEQLGGNMRLIVIPGKGYAWDTDYFQSADLNTFFYSQAPLSRIANASEITACKQPSIVKP
jgi:dienelactone hydrolase